MERSVRTISLFKSVVFAAGTSRASSPVDLRDIAKQGDFSLAYKVETSGGVGTCGTTTFAYSGCSVYDGTYVSPTSGTFGTSGNTGGSNILSFSPPVLPFMKITIAVGTSGTSVVTADLHVR